MLSFDLAADFLHTQRQILSCNAQERFHPNSCGQDRESASRAFSYFKKEGTITAYTWYNKHPSSPNTERNSDFSQNCMEENLMAIHFAISGSQKNSFPSLFISLTTRKLCTMTTEVLHMQHVHSLQHENCAVLLNSTTGCLQRQANWRYFYPHLPRPIYN